MFVKRRRIVAEAEIDPQMDAPVEDVDMPADDAGDVTVDEEATDLLFETDDVAQLVAEVTGEDVDVTVDDETINNGTVTVRDRDTMKQDVIKVEDLKDYLNEKVKF